MAEWYKRAKHDLDKARETWNGAGTPTPASTLNRPVKILKAYLRSRGVVVRTHRIEELPMLAKDQGLSVGDLLEDKTALKELSNQYLTPRYPNFRGGTARNLEDYDVKFAEACLEMAMKIWSRVKESIDRWISDQPS